MKAVLRRIAGPDRRSRAWIGLLACCAAVGLASTAAAQPAPGPGQRWEVTERINVTGRTVVLTIPVKDGNVYLGDIALTILSDDRIEFPAPRMIDLLAGTLSPAARGNLIHAIAGRLSVSPGDLSAAGLALRYDAAAVELVVTMPVNLRAVRALQVSPVDGARLGLFDRPAGFSGYLTARGSVDYVEQGADPGLANPVVFLDGAARAGGVVLETQAVWQPGSSGRASVQRQGTRLVYDQPDRALRWTLGDLKTLVRGFQSAPDIAGISIIRSYGVLRPQMLSRPTGRQGFRLERPSTVEVVVNGQPVRRMRLDRGAYSLRDFPFTQGSNDVRLIIQDDTGRSETVRFDIFFDQSQLAPGLAEFALYAGVKTSLGAAGPEYSRDWAVSGYYRRGMSERLTVGVNAQADRRSRLAGAEAVYAMPAGVVAASLAGSDIGGRRGGAALVTFQRLIRTSQDGSDTLQLSGEAWTRDFARPSLAGGENPFKYRLGAGYGHAFGDRFFAGLDLRFAKARAGQRDVSSARVSGGWQITPRVSMTGDVMVEDEPGGKRNVALLLSLTARLEDNSSARASYDSRYESGRLSYQTQRGEGVGAYHVSVDVEQSARGSTLNGSSNYTANRVDLGLSHYTSFEGSSGDMSRSRTSLRAASAIAFADGAISIGRPIFDSFAIVTRHPSLGEAEVFLEPTPRGYAVGTGRLGTAIWPNLMSYAERTITIDAPGADSWTDLGDGGFRVLPPYRAGYRLMVGSDYSITVFGRLFDGDGAPVSLLAGRAIEMARPEREPVQLFTNREGKFGVPGLKPGHWRIEMPTYPATVYDIDIPASVVGIFQAGDLRPEPGEHGL
ncbi:MAG: fimbrial biogenesis outer membrane usher protein [Caulobacter sp.]|nr:fimbrial biogenesis outer membrane usher protein [Caulobacter sp.]